MNSADLERSLISWTAAHSGHDAHRQYIGLSGIGDCPRLIYHRVVHGTPATTEEKLKFAIGYELERALRERLRGVGVMDWPHGNQYLVQSPGGVACGHIDGCLNDGDLVEFKTIAREEWLPYEDRTVCDSAPKPWRRILHQVTAYMHFGGFSRGHVVYLARDTGAVRVVPVVVDLRVVREIEETIRTVRAALDSGTPPACRCGRCQ